MGKCKKRNSESTEIKDNFRRLDLDILKGLVEKLQFKPTAKYYTPEVHFECIKQFCMSNNVNEWKNLFNDREERGILLFREHLMRLVPDTSDKSILLSNSKCFLLTWFVTKLKNLLSEIAQDELHRNKEKYLFLLLTVGYVTKLYNNYCSNGQKISRAKRRQILGLELDMVYQEAKRQHPSLWKHKLIPTEDRLNDVLDVSDDEGDDYPAEADLEEGQPKRSQSPLIQDETSVSLKKRIEIKCKEIKMTKIQITDLQNKHESLKMDIEETKKDVQELILLEANIKQRDSFILYYESISERLFPSTTRADEVIQLMDNFVALKSYAKNKTDKTLSATQLFSNWIETLKQDADDADTSQFVDGNTVEKDDKSPPPKKVKPNETFDDSREARIQRYKDGKLLSALKRGMFDDKEDGNSSCAILEDGFSSCSSPDGSIGHSCDDINSSGENEALNGTVVRKNGQNKDRIVDLTSASDSQKGDSLENVTDPVKPQDNVVALLLDIQQECDDIRKEIVDLTSAPDFQKGDSQENVTDPVMPQDNVAASLLDIQKENQLQLAQEFDGIRKEISNELEKDEEKDLHEIEKDCDNNRSQVTISMLKQKIIDRKRRKQ